MTHAFDLPIGDLLPTVTGPADGLGPEPGAAPPGSAPPGSGATIHELFDEAAGRSPDAVALHHGGRLTSYADLRSMSVGIAVQLVRRGVRPGDVVGIAMAPCPQRIAAVLAVWRAGAAYLPLDPELPADRLRGYLADAAARLVIAAAPVDLGPPVLVPWRPAAEERDGGGDVAWWPAAGERGDGGDVAWRPAAGERDGGGDLPPGDPERLAYVMFTSGSTGRPKAVGIRQRSLVDRLTWMVRELAVQPADRVLHKTAFGFDVSVWEQLLALIVGARVVIAPDGVRGDARALDSLIADAGVTVVHFVPTMLAAFVEAGGLATAGSLRVVICSGEELPRSLAAAVADRGGVAVHNYYGPTEATIDVAAGRFDAADPRGFVPLGRPIAGSRLYVLDSHLGHVPVGGHGELYVGGPLVGAGYLGRPGLTAERFLPDPFGGAPGARLYRTGDLVRLHHDGALEFLGRTDHQVKIRGFRIEPGEVERRLLAHPAVSAAAVVARDAGSAGRQLVAYLVGDERGGTPTGLREWLGRLLPDHMIPAHVVWLPRLPVTSAGKLDRAALPAPRVGGTGGAAPTTEPQRVLCRIWTDLLGLPSVGIDDNFFQLGGDSIACIRVVARARAHGWTLQVKDVFDAPTIRALAGRARRTDPGRRPDAAVPAPLRPWLAPAAGSVQLVLAPYGPLQPAALAAAVARQGHPWLRVDVQPSPAGARVVFAADARAADRRLLAAVARRVSHAYRTAARDGGRAEPAGFAAPEAVLAWAATGALPGGAEWTAAGTGAPVRAVTRHDLLDVDLTRCAAPESPTTAGHLVQGALLTALARGGIDAVQAAFAEDDGWARGSGWCLSRVGGRLAARRIARLRLRGDDPQAMVRRVKHLVRGGVEDATRDGDAAGGGVLTVDVRFLELTVDDPLWTEDEPRARVRERATGADLAVVFTHRPGRLTVEWLAGAAAPALAGLTRALRAVLGELAAADPAGTRVPSDFPGSGLTAEQLRPALGDLPDVTDAYPLSPLQEGLLVRSLYWPASDAYHNQNVIEVRGPFDIEVFRRSWAQVVRRYELLRTGFRWRGLDAPIQYTVGEPPQRTERHDWCHLGPAAQDAALTRLLDDDRSRPFDLSAPSPYRLHLVSVAPDRHLIVWSHHHILLDGWCLSLIWGDTFRIYAARRAGGTVDPPAPRPFRDFIRWLSDRRTSAADTGFWRGYLADFTEPTRFSRRERSVEGRFDTIRTRYDADRTGRLLELARAVRVTPNAVVQAAWSLTLSVCSGQRDVVHGVSISGRPPELDGVEHMVGLFINAVPLRVRLPGTQPVRDLLLRVQGQLAAASAHGHVPLTSVTAAWQAGGPQQRLFDSLVAFESYPEDNLPGEQVGDLRVVDRFAVEKTEYPLGLIVLPGAELELHWNYDTAHFGRAEIERIRRTFDGFVTQMIDHPTRRLADLDLNGPRPVAAPVAAEVAAAPRPDDCVVRRFEAVVAAAPEATAVLEPGGPIGYRELSAQVRSVAARLVAAGVTPGDRVAVSDGRSAARVRALLATMAVGAVPLLLDPLLPVARRRAVIADAGAVVVTGAAAPPGGPPPVGTGPPFPAADPVPARVHPIAYLAYTSGSTGRPKGVACPQRGLLTRLDFSLRAYRTTRPPRLLANAETGFDISVWEVLFPLLAGGTVVFDDGAGVSDMDALAAAVAVSQISVLHLVPSALRLFAEVPGARRCHSLEVVVTGGETLHPDVVTGFAELGLPARLHHAYGPTEASISVTDLRCRPEHGRRDRVPLGDFIPGCRGYLLDDALRPVPTGVAGDLYLSGDCLAAGYPGRPAETAAAFLPDPFAGGPARMYRTGDRARRLDGGDLEFLGRRDRQVKVRGHRIELSEVERVLAGHPGVGAAAVVVDDTGELAAFVLPRRATPAPRTPADATRAVPSPGGHHDPAALRSWLAARLPSWMVPRTVRELDELPRTGTGKTDRRALAARPSEAAPAHRPAAPRNDLERVIVGCWQEVLGRDGIGVHDDVFTLGAHSLSVMRMLSRLRRALPAGVRVELPMLFTAHTVAELAEQLAVADDDGDTPRIRTVHQRGDRAPLMLVHASDGLAFAYDGLRGRITDRPVYAFGDPRFGDDEHPFGSVTAMASVYVQWARALAGDGPVVLGGWSFGGIVALQMARTLADHGAQVPAVLLIDAHHPSGPAGRGPSYVPGRYPVVRAALATEVARNAALARSWRPCRYAGRVVLLRARDDCADRRAGWPVDLLPALEVVDLPGGHHDLLGAAGAPGTAAAMAAVLDR